MKKFYLHNGREQQGPFDIEELKEKNITKETSIWCEGLSEWTTANKIDELRDFFKTATPPPFGAKTATPPPISKTAASEKKTVQEPAVKRKKTSRGVFIFFGLIVIVFGGHWIADKISGNGSSSGSEMYQAKVMTIEEIERSQPTRFLKASGDYNENFWGDKIKVHGIIKNTATVAAFKDAVVRVTYYSKTKTELGSKEYPIYEYFPPHSEVKFELKIEKYKDVNGIGWDVIQATAN